MVVIDRPLCVIDTETTGVDPVKDRIIEFAAVVIDPSGSRRTFCQRFNPGIPIPAEVTEVHGISDADVADCPPFSEFAVRIARALHGKDIAGYNLRGLDLPIIDEELRRCALKLDLNGVRVIDACTIFRKKEPRTLSDAVKKYCGRSHEDAHGALADAAATADVLDGQLSAYPDLEAMSLSQLDEFCLPESGRPADISGKLYVDADGDLRYAFGKHKDRKVRDEQSYASWMLSKDFPGNTLDMLAAELDRILESVGVRA